MATAWSHKWLVHQSGGSFQLVLTSEVPIIRWSGANERFPHALALLNRLGWRERTGSDEPHGFTLGASLPRWALAPGESIGQGHILALFEQVFGQAMPETLWAWKYAEGRGRAMTASRDGELVAHYGGVTRRILFKGEPALGLQVCDVMVAPGERAVMTRRGVFLQTAAAFLELYCGLEQQHRVAYGFPNARHMRLAERLGLYGEVDALVEQRWAATEGFQSWQYQGCELSGGDLSPPDFHSVWQAMAQDFTEHLLVVRDADYLRYRYVDHPVHRYVLLGLRHRWTGRLQGVVVMRPEADQCRLMDLIGPVRLFPRLIELARSRVPRGGATALTGWFTRSQITRLASAGGVTQPVDIAIPANTWSVGPPLSALQDRWWLTMGDTDFL